MKKGRTEKWAYKSKRRQDRINTLNKSILLTINIMMVLAFIFLILAISIALWDKVHDTYIPISSINPCTPYTPYAPPEQMPVTLDFPRLFKL